MGGGFLTLLGKKCPERAVARRPRVRDTKYHAVAHVRRRGWVGVSRCYKDKLLRSWRWVALGSDRSLNRNPFVIIIVIAIVIIAEVLEIAIGIGIGITMGKTMIGTTIETKIGTRMGEDND